jgi:branched-chain amino acid aminotransferase
MIGTESGKVWMNGTLVDTPQAKVSVLSHTLHYGVGVFEGIRGYSTPKGGAIFRLRDHVKRLILSAKVYRMPIPYTEEEILEAIVNTQAANDFYPSYIRPVVYRDGPALGVKNLTTKVQLAIAVVPAKKYLGEKSDGGIRAKLSPFRKPRSDSLPAMAKANGNYLGGYLAGTDASQDGYEEAILLDSNGYLAEGTGENIFLVRGGTLYTPSPEGDILLGITRDSVIHIAQDLGFPVVEKTLSVGELLTADEAFFAGTYAEIAPIREISHYNIGNGKPGPMTRDIMDVFYKTVHGEEPRYSDWLYPVPPIAKPVPRASRR